MPFKIYWQSVDFSSLLIEEWDGEFTVFQPDSGKTHFLNPAGMQIVSRLDQSPASVDEICKVLAEHFQLTLNQNYSQQIIETLHRFEELGLVEKARLETSV